MNYNINTYLINDLEGECVVQTKSSLTIIHNEKMIELLKYIEEKRISILNDSIMKNFFSEEEYLDVYSFLQDERLIELKNNKIVSIKNILIISNESKFENIFMNNFKEKFESIKNINVENFYKNQDILKNIDTVYVFLNPFNLEEYETINKIIINKNKIVQNIFYYNNSIYISNLYKKEWANPCPLCFFSILESKLRGIINEENWNFQTIVDLIYTKSPKFKIEAKLSIHDYMPVCFILLKYLENIDLENRFDAIYEIELEKYKISTDYCYHWEVCDCYE